MSLQQIVDGQQEGCWLRDVRRLLGALPGYVLTKEETNVVVERLIAALKAHREGHAINWAALGLTRTSGQFLAAARRKGVFRLSQFDYRHKYLAKTTRELSKAAARNWPLVRVRPR